MATKRKQRYITLTLSILIYIYKPLKNIVFERFCRGLKRIDMDSDLYSAHILSWTGKEYILCKNGIRRDEIH